MKRPEQTSTEPDYNFIDRIEAYADQLEEKTYMLAEALHDAETDFDEWKEHVFDDDQVFPDGHGNEILLDDVCEGSLGALDEFGTSRYEECEGNVIGLDSEGGVVFDAISGDDDDPFPDEEPIILEFLDDDESKNKIMLHILDAISYMVDEMKEMIDDEST